jgi:flotillin
MYFVGQANEYLAITGINIADVKIAKKAFVWPFQKFKRFNITPKSFTVDLHAMTIEKLECIRILTS